MTTKLYTVDPAAGKLTFAPHSGQWRAWNSKKRFVIILAGTQSGKTAFGPVWMYKEIQAQGPGDYMVVTPTFPLLNLKALPEFQRYFDRTLDLGRFYTQSRKFEFSDDGSKRTFGDRYDPEIPTNVIFGYAAEPESLESATAKAVWADECGQRRFSLGSFQALLRRLSLARGRFLGTTTPYNLGWLYQELYKPWKRARQLGSDHPDIDVISFDSTTNPVFPRAEFERARDTMPAWQFNMFYRGRFERPAGQIYDCFDADRQVIEPFALSPHWQRYVGVDFGGVHTAAVFLAEEPGTGRLFLYREYLAGGRTAREHADVLVAGEPMIPYAVGGAKAEGQWRQEFRAAGLVMQPPPISDVELGIQRVYGTIKRGELLVFRTCTGVLDQLGSYSRVLDAMYQPTAAIEDKNSYHYLDAARYVIAHLRPGDPVTVDADVASELVDFTGW